MPLARDRRPWSRPSQRRGEIPCDFNDVDANGGVLIIVQVDAVYATRRRCGVGIEEPTIE